MMRQDGKSYSNAFGDNAVFIDQCDARLGMVSNNFSIQRYQMPPYALPGVMDTAVTILLVEDEALLRTLLVAQLEDAGFQVAEAENGHEAMRLLDMDYQTFAAVVTDIRMPGDLSGWDVARHSRELNPAMPVVYMTGDSGIDWSAQGVPHSQLLQKPFVGAQLVAAVMERLNRAANHPFAGSAITE